MATRRSIPKRTRIAHHEAGHGVLSAAINDAPELVSIRPSGGALGRSRYRMEGRAERLVQVHLAGFAAEEILKGRRSKQLGGPELGLSVLAVTVPSYTPQLAGLETCDQYLAVQEVVAMGCDKTDDAIRAEFERFYAIAKESVLAVWPAVVAVASALLKCSELSSDEFFTALQGHDIYRPVFAIQEAHGLDFASNASSTRPRM